MKTIQASRKYLYLGSLLIGAVLLITPGFTLAASKASPTLSIACAPLSVKVGKTTTCIATLKGFKGAVTGDKVTFSKTAGTGSVTFSTCTLSSTGTCFDTVKGKTAGSVTIHAVFAGNKDNNKATSNKEGLTVTKA